MRRFALVFAIITALCAFAPSQSRERGSTPLEANYGRTGIQWSVFVPSTGLILTVAGPDGLIRKQVYPAHARPQFDLLDEQGVPRPEGLYRWELTAQHPPVQADNVSSEPNLVASGSFLVSGGRIIPRPDDGQPAAIEEGAPVHSLFVDRTGRVGLGTSVPASELHLKGNNPGLTIEDTTTGGRAHTVHSFQAGDGSVGLFDQATGQARWLVDREGRIGINTTKPTSSLTVDGYIEATKGFLVNGRPIGGFGLGLSEGSQPLAWEMDDNTYFGLFSGHFDPIPLRNSFFGAYIGTQNMGVDNSFFGCSAGESNAFGRYNSFFGSSAGRNNEGGTSNSFFGYQAGHSNSEGSDNSIFGAQAGSLNTTGESNCFFGKSAGRANTTASYNSFFGKLTGNNNTDGSYNAYFGFGVGAVNTSGEHNSFFGIASGRLNTTGSGNSFFGSNVGASNTTESDNSLFGKQANINPGPTPGTVHNATAIGAYAYVAQSNSLVLGGVNGFNGAQAETFVGIGTTSPDRQLVVEGSQALGKFRRYSAATPTHAPAFLFERARGTNTAPADIVPGDYLGKVQFRGRVGGNMPEYGAFTFLATDTNQNGRFSFVDRDLVTERMVILNTGNVGIGTNAPTERLDVAGNVRIRGSVVSGAPVAIPDYVFESDYRLMPLRELGAYVKAEKHLPMIPKASELQASGINLGEFQMKLLEKVEELTLYALQQAQENDQLKERIRTLEEMVKTLLESAKGRK